MASVKQARNVVQLNDKEKAKVGQALKEAEAFLANKAMNQEFAMVAGAMRNSQDRPISVAKIHSYFGEFLANPPESVPGNGSGAFISKGAPHSGALPVVVGSKAMMIYGQVPEKSAQQLGWLLAFYKPDDSNGPNKVYVEAGLLSRLMDLDLKEIEKKLDESAGISRYWDSATGAAASALIEDKGNKLALLGANFEIIMD